MGIGMNIREAKFLCVSYDISDNKRRNRVYKTLKRYGLPVQYSVFECWLTESQVEQMRQELARIVVDDDSVRFYDLCHACHRETITVGTAQTTHLKLAYIF